MHSDISYLTKAIYHKQTFLHWGSSILTGCMLFQTANQQVKAVTPSLPTKQYSQYNKHGCTYEVWGLAQILQEKCF